MTRPPDADTALTRVREFLRGLFHPVEGGCAGDPSAFERDMQRAARERKSPGRERPSLIDLTPRR